MPNRTGVADPKLNLTNPRPHIHTQALCAKAAITRGLFIETTSRRALCPQRKNVSRTQQVGTHRYFTDTDAAGATTPLLFGLRNIVNTTSHQHSSIT